MDVLSSIDHSITLVRRLREISKNVAEAEFRNLLADLSNDLGDAKLEIAALKQRLADQAEEIAALKAADPAVRQKPSGEKYGCYQFEGEDGLFCTACYDTKGRKSRTTRLNSHFRQCPVCKAMFGS
jgi:hypothetical protein